jgi:hypothetical protein
MGTVANPASTNSSPDSWYLPAPCHDRSRHDPERKRLLSNLPFFPTAFVSPMDLQLKAVCGRTARLLLVGPLRRHHPRRAAR